MSRTSSTFARIVGQVKNQLIEQGVFNDNTIFVGVDPEMTALDPSISYAILTPAPCRAINHESNFVLDWSIDITIYHFCGLDEGDRGNIGLSERAEGLYFVVDAIINTLALHDLSSGDQKILVRPMRLNSVSGIRERGKWYTVTLNWECRFQYSLN